MKKAMTLAEVLIVLTIIGVTFVISMPILNNYFKNNDNRTRLKKVQMILDDFIGRSEIANGPMDTWPVGAAVGNMKTSFWPKYMQPFFTSSKKPKNGALNICPIDIYIKPRRTTREKTSLYLKVVSSFFESELNKFLKKYGNLYKKHLFFF